MQTAGRVRIAAFAVLCLLCWACAASADTLRWETWAENEVAGGASEGTHAWVTHGLYQRGRELGMSRAGASATALVVMAGWEVYEVETMDARGVSVQDLAANAAGVLAGVAGVGLNYSYASLKDPRRDEESPWMGVPILPRNEISYAIEIEVESFTFGYKYLDNAGDLVVGTTSMPVLAGERDNQKVIGYVGRVWPNGCHAALGYDGHGEVTLGGGYRLTFQGLGLDLTTLADPRSIGFGLSCFVSYRSVF